MPSTSFSMRWTSMTTSGSSECNTQPWGFCRADNGRMKETGEEYDGRVVEVTWDMKRGGWRMFRFRDDKPHGNHAKTVRSVLHSIEDGVEIADVSGFTCQQLLPVSSWSLN